MFSNNCSGYCEPEGFVISKESRKALLKEKEAILEAKLATVRHWIEESESEKDSDK